MVEFFKNFKKVVENTVHNKIQCTTKYSAQQNTVHNKIQCTSKYSAQQNTVHNKIQCTTKYSAQQNTVHNKIQCTTKYSAQQNTVHNKIGNFFLGHLQLNPCITTSVYATPRLYRQILCGTNQFLTANHNITLWYQSVPHC